MERILPLLAFVIAIAIAGVALFEINDRNDEEPQAIPTVAPSLPPATSETPQGTAVASVETPATSQPVTPLETATTAPRSPTPTPRPPATPTPTVATQPPRAANSSGGSTPTTGGGAVGGGLAVIAFAVIALAFVRATATPQRPGGASDT